MGHDSAILDEAGARAWCDEQLETFIDFLIERLPEEDMTQGNIREAAKEFLSAHKDDPSFAPIAERADGTNGLFLGVVILAMAEYLLERVVARFA